MASSRAVVLAAAIGLLVQGAKAQVPAGGSAPAGSAPAGSAQESAARRPGVGVELNKLEPTQGGCRAYFVVENRTPEPIRELRLDTFIFDAGGQIARRLGLAFPDLRPDRTRVVPFDLAGAACPEIGRVLVNDVLACTGAAGAPVPGCADLLAVTSRAAARLDY